MTGLHLDCFSGLAGDMFVGALLDLGGDFHVLQRGLDSLGVGGYRLERRTVERGALTATKFDVILDSPGGDSPARPEPAAEPLDAAPGPEHARDDEHEHRHDNGRESGHTHEHAHPHRGLPEIRSILAGGALPGRVRERALAAFERLAWAEARVHGSTPEEVHFHEVGAVDAICDVVGVCLLLEDLGVDRVTCGPVRVGSGFVRCAHGTMPVPAPATLECLTGFDVRLEEGRGELVTPTGAALLAALATPLSGPLRPRRVGYGAGTRNPPDVPNVLRAVLVEDAADDRREELVELVTNLDHLPSTSLPVALDAALAAGALDAYVLPCTMKKGRPAHLFVALVRPAERLAVEDALFRSTGTLGIRGRAVDRRALPRTVETVETPFGPVRIKTGRLGEEVTSRVPEFEDCRRLAERSGVSLARVADAARRATEADPGVEG